MKIEELNRLSPKGYRVEDLSAGEKAQINLMLIVVDEIRIEPLEYDSTTIIGKIKKEIAQETVDDLRNNIMSFIADKVVISMLEEHLE